MIDGNAGEKDNCRVPIDFADCVLLFFAAMAAGWVDAIAGGGGLIAVPALLATGIAPQIALGTNKLQSTCGTALATLRYFRAGLIDLRGLHFGIGITFITALIGSWAATRLSPDVLNRVIPFLLLAIALYLAIQSAPSETAAPPRMKRTVFLLTFGTTLGFYDGFFGPGTGSFWMAACIAFQGMSYRSATGTTKVLNLTSNLAALLGFTLTGNVHYQAGGVMIVGQLMGAFLGSTVAIGKGARVIRPLVILVAVALALRMLIKVF